ncbi:hypothetical protein CRG98_014966 [Punica granatum]|uniref:DUF7745 domain-containing protein n=1 Tax=Punica granatum TaxID=22663 RepID=A0A2I0K7U5_PUNGR|nr:hypothetical protein CRG98_014966 [Punica granatum]
MPTIEEYQTLIGRTALAQGIVEPNLRTTRLVLVSRLLKVHRSQLHAELAYSGGIEIVTTKLLCFIESRARKVRGDIFQMNLCHAVLLLIFGTLLFPSVANRIDTALASVVLQVVGGRGYEVALAAETIRSLDRVTQTTDQRLRGSPILLQIWLQSHASPFGLVRPILFFNCSESIISRLLPLVRVEKRKVLSAWRTAVTELPYFPKHPTQDERDFQAMEEYILHFYRWSPSAHENFTGSPRPEGSTLYGAPSSMVIQVELTSFMFERDCLRWEVVEKDKQLIDQCQLQRELAQTHAKLQRREQELARANTALERFRKRTRGGPHLS